MTTALAASGAEFETKNPVTQLMSDRKHGVVREDILDEKVLSAIVEMKSDISQVDLFIDVIESVAPTLDTVVSLGVSALCLEDSSNPIEDIMQRRGYPVIRGKTNLGLGRATNPQPSPSSATARAEA